MKYTAQQAARIPYPPAIMQLRKEAYFKAVQPLLKMRCEIYSVAIPTMKIYADGRIEHDHNFTDEQKMALHLIGECINFLQRSMDLTPEIIYML